MNNFFDDIPTAIPNEVCSTLVESEHVRIERIVSHGQPSPEGFWYEQDKNEWVVVISGSAQLKFEDETIDLEAGDFVNIPAYKKHRVAWTTPTEPTIWLAVHYS